MCGANDTGFGALVNFNSFGAGTHTAQLLIDGAAVATTQFAVVVPWYAFSTSLRAVDIPVPAFPTLDDTTILRWQEEQQNFAIKAVLGPNHGITEAGRYDCSLIATGLAQPTPCC